MKISLNEKQISVGEILERERSKLPEGVLSRVKYPVCNIGELNRNKRIYGKEVWEKVMGDSDIKEKLNTRTLYMHAEHPKEMQSSTEKIAGIVTEFIIDEAKQKVYNVVEILDTPFGRVCDTLLRANCGLGVSTRAEGELEECLDEKTGSKYFRVVPETYRYVTTDFTADPSTIGAYPESVERDVVGIIKNGLESKKIDSDYASVMLEKFQCKEAVALLESIRKPLKEDSQDNESKSKDRLAAMRKRRGESNSVNEIVHYDNILKPAFVKKAEADDLALTLAEIQDDLSSGNVPKEDKEKAKQCISILKAEIARRKKSSESVNEDIGDLTPEIAARIDELVNQQKIESIMKLITEVQDELAVEGIDEVLSREWFMRELFGPETDIFYNESLLKSLTSHTLFESVDAKLSIKEKFNHLMSYIRRVEERLAVSEAERIVACRLGNSSLAEMKERYRKDVLDFNEKISNIKANSSRALIEAKQEFDRQLEKERSERIVSEKNLVEATNTKLSETYAAKFKSLQEKFDAEIDEMKEEYRKTAFKRIVEFKIKEAGIADDLTPDHLTLLESCANEKALDSAIDKLRLRLREATFHSSGFKKTDESIVIHSGEPENKETADSLGQTRRYLKHMK